MASKRKTGPAHARTKRQRRRKNLRWSRNINRFVVVTVTKCYVPERKSFAPMDLGWMFKETAVTSEVLHDATTGGMNVWRIV